MTRCEGGPHSNPCPRASWVTVSAMGAKTPGVPVCKRHYTVMTGELLASATHLMVTGK